MAGDHSKSHKGWLNTETNFAFDFKTFDLFIAPAMAEHSKSEITRFDSMCVSASLGSVDSLARSFNTNYLGV